MSGSTAHHPQRAGPRHPQPAAARGSQHWLQLAVSRCPQVLEEPLAAALGLAPGEIEWRSPLAADDFAEYRDHGFLDRLGVALPHRSLGSFWPPGGPQWDGLAVCHSGGVILVEAKAHAGELASRCRASPESLARIRAALQETASAAAFEWSEAWLDGYYQYANRLAHLYLLRVANGVPASLAFIYFTGDAGMGGPADAAGWAPALAEMHAALRLRPRPLDGAVVEVFADVGAIRAAP